MYKELLDALMKKFSGVSEKVLGRIATKLAETAKTAEEVTTAVEGVTFAQVLESYGDSRATDATKTAVLNYEKKHNLKDGKPVKASEDGNSKEDDEEGEDGKKMPAYFKAMMEQVKTLADKVDQMAGQRVTDNRKARLDDVLKGLPQWQRKGYERINLTSLKDDEFETMLAEVSTEVGEIVKHQGQQRATFGQPSVSGNPSEETQVKQATDKEVEAVMSHMSL